MKRTLAAALALSLLGALAVTAPSCAEPTNDCTTGHGVFAVRYTLVPGSKQGNGTCDQLLGEPVGLEKYNPSTTSDPNIQDLTRATLAMKSNTLGVLVNAEETANVMVDVNQAISLGDFVSIKPDANGICSVATLSPAEINAPMLGTMAATDIKYEWSNVRVLVTPSYDGVEMTADLTFTQDGCSAQYKALGLFPSVSCAVTDSMGNVTGTDPTLCDPAADLDAGHAAGSGINPDFQSNVVCDPMLMLCVLAQPPAALQ